MNKFKTISKYVHILYYITTFALLVDFVLMIIAPALQIGIAGPATVLGLILGLASIFAAIKEKSTPKIIIDLIIPIILVLIVLFGPGI